MTGEILIKFFFFSLSIVMMIDNYMKQSEKFVSEFRLSKTAKGQLLPKAINLLQLGLTHMRKKINLVPHCYG